MLEVFVSVDAAEDLWTLQTQFKPCRYMTDRQADKHFYLTSEKIRYQGEENDRKVFESSSPEGYFFTFAAKLTVKTNEKTTNSEIRYDTNSAPSLLFLQLKLMALESM